MLVQAASAPALKKKRGGLFRWQGIIPIALLGIVLGGLLIGLGAPFWYSAVQALTGVRRMARGDKEAPQSTTSAAPSSSGPADMPSTPIEAFHAAHGALYAAGELRPYEEAVG